MHEFNVNKNNLGLILSPKSAGVGLNLTVANNVIHYGRWWNPAIESQATDRVYRIGQTKEVRIYYLNFFDESNKVKSFDEYISDILNNKHSVTSDFLVPNMSEDDVFNEFKHKFSSNAV